MNSKAKEELVIIHDDDQSPVGSALPPWKILIADDDEDVHAATKLALNDFIFMDRVLKIYNAYSASETIQLLKKEKDIAAILLDVVMETDDAGLLVINQIREQLNNYDIRVILRTGQPGHAPELDVINNYDINDYKTKSELSQGKLLATITTALRSYDQIKKLHSARNKLKRLSMFPERSHNSICQLSLQGDIIYTNPSSKIILENRGISSTDLTLLFPDNYKQLLIDLQESDTEFERCEYNCGNGVLQCHVQYLKDISIFNLYIEDITERKQLEKQLVQSQKMETIGQLAAGMSYDFNNILASILGYSRLARRLTQKMENTELERYLGEIIKAGSRASKLVDEMLLFVRSDAPTAKITSVKDIVMDSLKLMQGSFPSSIKTKILADDDISPILIDPIQLQQILMNLCINANDAMNEVGELLIELQEVHITENQQLIPSRLPDKKSIRIDMCFCQDENELMHMGDFIELSVKDTGSGIPKEKLEHIFEPYYSNKEVGQGTGMGLSVVHGIMEKVKGHIIVETEENKGTLIRLLFKPSDATEKSEATMALSDYTTSYGRGRILVVDDDNDISTLTKIMFSDYSHEVTKCLNAEEALTLFKETPYKFNLVIITDQTMPKLTGIDLSDNLLEIRPDIPIILYTNYSTLIYEAQSKKIDIRAFLKKPVDPEQFMNKVHELLSEFP